MISSQTPLARHILGLDQLAAAGGPVGERTVVFSAWIAELAAMIERGQIGREQWLAEWRPIVMQRFNETLASKVLLKPHGYAGDFEVIDCIYTRKIAAVYQQKPWDEYFHSLNAISAVRNRKHYFQRMMTKAVHRAATLGLGEPHILNVASGPGRDMVEWLIANPDVQATIECVEMDAKAIAFARDLCSDHGQRVNFHHANALRFTAKKGYSLIWSAGLFDYLSDTLFVRLLHRLLYYLLPGGEVVIGNFGPYNPSRVSMELLGDWVLQHRSPEHLRELALDAGAAEQDITVGREPACVNLFLHVQKPTQGCDR